MKRKCFLSFSLFPCNLSFSPSQFLLWFPLSPCPLLTSLIPFLVPSPSYLFHLLIFFLLSIFFLWFSPPLPLLLFSLLLSLPFCFSFLCFLSSLRFLWSYLLVPLLPLSPCPLVPSFPHLETVLSHSSLSPLLVSSLSSSVCISVCFCACMCTCVSSSCWWLSQLRSCWLGVFSAPWLAGSGVMVPFWMTRLSPVGRRPLCTVIG